jgi:hypothetical protein
MLMLHPYVYEVQSMVQFILHELPAAENGGVILKYWYLNIPH